MVLFAVFDFIWWGVLIKNFFTNNMSHLMRVSDGRLDIFYPSAIFVYFVMSVSLTYFCVWPSHITTPLQAAMTGAILGFCLFATFDFTNHALIANYPIKFSIVDVCWGTFMCASVSALGFWMTRTQIN